MKLFLAVLCLCVVGCASRPIKNTVANSYALQPGMVAWQVEDTLGKPHDIQRGSEAEVWYYNVYTPNNRAIPYLVVFKNGLTVSAQADEHAAALQAQDMQQRQEAARAWASTPTPMPTSAPTTTCQSIPNGFGGFTTKCR